MKAIKWFLLTGLILVTSFAMEQKASVTGTVTDQGIDIANGDYHYYAFTMPPGNAGIIRAQLIAISGNKPIRTISMLAMIAQPLAKAFLCFTVHHAMPLGIANSKQIAYTPTRPRITGEGP